MNMMVTCTATLVTEGSLDPRDMALPVELELFWHLNHNLFEMDTSPQQNGQLKKKKERKHSRDFKNAQFVSHDNCRQRQTFKWKTGIHACRHRHHCLKSLLQNDG